MSDETTITPAVQGSQEQPSATPVIKPAAPKAETPKVVPVAPVVPVPETPVEPEAPKPTGEIDPADLLFELDRRGFRSMEEAIRLIKRYDNAVKEADMAEARVKETVEEQKKLEVRFAAREAELVAKAKEMLAARADQESRLKQINDRIALLSKLES